MKVPKSVLKLLENKYVLYFVLFLAITNLLGYMMIGNMNAVILFVLIGGLMTFFSKNMIIVLAVPLVLTSVLLVGSKVSEGFREGMDDPPADPPADPPVNPAVNPAASSTTPDSCGTIITTDSNGTTYTDAKGNPLKNSDGSLVTNYSCTNGKITESMASLYKKKNNRIDYASTLEDAYGDLDSILGKDGIKGLTTDTQKLMEQQMQLADALKGMAPLIGDAKKMLAGMDISGLTDMAKKFAPPPQP